MSSDELARTHWIFELASRELAAYLTATCHVLGCREPLISGNLWIDTMCSLRWPENGYARFFRAVTILAIMRIVEGAEASRWSSQYDSNVLQ
jgi:hypothetical protein